MNYNNHNNQDNRWRTVAIFCICLLVIVGIVYMKHSSNEQKLYSTLHSPDSSHQQVAIPDTTIDPTTLPQSADTVVTTQLPDTILGKDTRNPYEAGYDDGYASGCDDGAAGTNHASYDETSSFSTNAERQNYAKGYREGYAKGYEDGRQGKQFNI